MSTDSCKRVLRDILAPADITLNGNRPWDIQVRNERFYRRVLGDGSLGFGESYMDGWWECDRLDELFSRLIPSRPERKLRKNWKVLAHVLGAAIVNRASRARAFQIGERHYDLGNELYRGMLDRRMVYSCGYWKEAGDLESAQEAKLDLICRKLGLRCGNRVLDIGCGWGGFAAYAAERYGVEVVGVTVSREQAKHCEASCKGLRVDVRLQDYRDVREQFDHIVSVGMFEHVGRRNHRTFMRTVHRCLKDDGLFLLHTIGSHENVAATDAWFDKYIFPNSLIPSMKQISASIAKLFIIEDLHNIGADYDATLSAWFRNFDSHWNGGSDGKSERFYRMWKYYLLSCAGAFRARDLQVWQIVLSRNGVRGGYRSVR